MVEIREITPCDLARRLEANDDLLLLDVREPFELSLARLPRVHHIPMREIAARVGQLEPARETIVICHHGIRSAQVCAFLVHHGFDRVYNLRGGIDAWSREVDPELPRY